MTRRFPVFTVALFALAATAGAQGSLTKDPVTLTLSPAAKAAVAGGTTSLKLAAAIQAGWHIYSLTQPPGGPNKTKIIIPDSQAFSLAGTIKGDAPDVAFDKNFNINVETYEKSAEFSIPLNVSKATKPGTQQAYVNVRYQVCNAMSCLPPKTVELVTNVKVKKAKSRA